MRNVLSIRPRVDACDGCALGRASSAGACPFRNATRSAGTLLLSQGEVPSHVSFIRSGTVLLSAIRETGEETCCSLRGAGSLLGLEAWRGQPTACEAWALTDVVLCRLTRASFDEWLGGRGSPLGVVLESALVEASAWQQDRMALAGRTVARLARFLVERQAMDEGDAPLAIEHRMLARMLGMRAETLSRALAKLREAGALRAEPGLRVADARVLRAIAGDSGEEERDRFTGLRSAID